MSRIKKEQAEIEKKYILEELKKGTKQIDIAKSIGRSSSYISNMKKRLIEEKLLEEVTDGRKKKQIRIQEKGQDDVKELIRDTMENIYKLSVPLKVGIEYGKNWYEAK